MSSGDSKYGNDYNDHHHTTRDDTQQINYFSTDDVETHTNSPMADYPSHYYC